MKVKKLLRYKFGNFLTLISLGSKYLYNVREKERWTWVQVVNENNIVNIDNRLWLVFTLCINPLLHGKRSNIFFYFEHIVYVIYILHWWQKLKPYWKIIKILLKDKINLEYNFNNYQFIMYHVWHISVASPMWFFSISLLLYLFHANGMMPIITNNKWYVVQYYISNEVK